MHGIDVAPEAAAITLSLCATVSDVRTRRIPNALTYSGVIAGVIGRTVLQGGAGLRDALLGGLVSGGLFLLFFLFRAMGAGDVKLMTAIGCLVGPEKALQAVLATAIVGGILAVGYALWRRRLRTTLANVGDILRFHAAFRGVVHPTLNLSNAEAVRMPYALPIAIGVVYTVCAGLH